MAAPESVNGTGARFTFTSMITVVLIEEIFTNSTEKISKEVNSPEGKFSFGYIADACFEIFNDSKTKLLNFLYQYYYN